MELRRRLIGNYWLVPALLTGIGLVCGVGLATLGQAVDVAPLMKLLGLERLSPEGARTILSVGASSTITVAGVVFSITTLAMANMSSQYGARVLTTFMEDRGSQVTLGIFLGTFVYCLVVLGQVRTGAAVPDQGLVPGLAFIVALVLMLGCLAALIYYIHHAADNLRIQTQTGSIGNRLAGVAARPEGGRQAFTEPDWASAGTTVTASAGYVQRVDWQQLVAIAAGRDSTLKVVAMPGDFLIEGDPLVHWLGERPPDAAGIREQFRLGRQRTAEQDFTYHFDELVEIAVRSLSPSVNDPFVAGNCVNWIAEGLVRLHRSGIDDGPLVDDGGQPRVYRRRLDFDAVVRGTCDQLIQYFAADRNASMELLSALARVRQRIEGDEPVLLETARRLVHAAARHLGERPMQELQQQLSRLTDPQTETTDDETPRAG